MNNMWSKFFLENVFKNENKGIVFKARLWNDSNDGRARVISDRTYKPGAL